MSETDAMTLTEFLLARIAEDEAVAREFDACEWAGVDAWGDGTDFFYGDNAPASVARVLAECAAKRVIVDYATNQHTSSPDYDHAMAVIAQPYADRPGWRSEWAL